MKLEKFKELIEYNMEEFSRNRNFDRCFPQEYNIEFYSKYLSEPAEENIIFWNWYKNKFNIDKLKIIINLRPQKFFKVIF